MPILRGSVTLSRFVVEPSGKARQDTRRAFLKGLQRHLFEPIDRRGDEERAAGFVELEDEDASTFESGNLFRGERALFSWRIDQLQVSAAHARDELKKWTQAFERENGRPPARGEKAQAKGEIRERLRKQARPRTRTHDVAWDLKTQRLQIWSASRKVVDEVVVALEEGFEVKLTPLIPGALATRAGLPDAALSPTALLVGGEEVAHG